MTGARRPRQPADRAPDFVKLGEKLSEAATALTEVRDHLVQVDARQAETLKRVAATEAGLDSVRDQIERAEVRRENTAREILGTQTQSYRQFSAQLDTVRLQMEAIQDEVRTHTAEAMKQATEGAASGVVKATNADKVAGRKAMTYLGIGVSPLAIWGAGELLAKAFALIQGMGHVKLGE